MVTSTCFRFLSVFTLVTLALAASGAAQTNTLDRPGDPVVLSGQSLPMLQSVSPSNVVAFRHRGGWEQVPVQVDERKWADFGVIYGGGPTGIASLVYADAGTYTGADTNVLFDADDELVLMAQDAGDRAPANACLPAGTFTNGPVELAITDALTGGTGYVYLFRSDGSLNPAAGRDYVKYQFTLLAGTYPASYNITSGPNPENSYVSNAWYRTHFSDRWIRDELNIYTGGASGVDILDRHKNLFAPGVCSRTENTFSTGEGAFIANKDGPVRAIRSYLGANSGPLTQRDHFFYERRQDIVTRLRVHAISGMSDLYDYSTNATGMTYFNSLNTNGVAINGVPDVVTAGVVGWELATGAQGSIITVGSVATDITPFAYTSYYSDDSTPSVTQCTGDAFEYAASGIWINQAIPNTDPGLGAANHLIATRVDYYDAPAQTVAAAALRWPQALMPLQVAVTNFQGDADCDGMADAWELAFFDSLNTDGTTDTDGDGVFNRAEYVAGTNPTNGVSVPNLAVALSSGQAVVLFTALRAEGPGYVGLERCYDLEERSAVDLGSWEGVPEFTSLLGTNQLVSYPAPVDAVQRCFRTRVELR